MKTTNVIKVKIKLNTCRLQHKVYSIFGKYEKSVKNILIDFS